MSYKLSLIVSDSNVRPQEEWTGMWVIQRKHRFQDIYKARIKEKKAVLLARYLSAYHNFFNYTTVIFDVSRVHNPLWPGDCAL